MTRHVLAAIAMLVGSVAPCLAYEAIPFRDGGAIRGRVRYVGEPPKPAVISITKDPEVCGHEKVPGDLLVSPRKAIRNVVVRLRDVPRGKPMPKPRTVRLRQKACEYVPRVAVFPAGSRIRIENLDEILHNTNTRSERNRPFTLAQPGFRRVFDKRIDEPEMPIRIRCDVHSWMAAWWIAQEHPYYALTDEDGVFAIEDVPPGSYTIEAWHETLGTITQAVTVAPHAALDVTLHMTSR